MAYRQRVTHIILRLALSKKSPFQAQLEKTETHASELEERTARLNAARSRAADRL